MGQGGYITLVNSTDSDWNRTGQHSYQMNSWDFPQTIAAKSSVRVYVEWDQGIFHNQSDDAGEANYTLSGTDNLAFQIQARAKKGFELQVFFDNLATNGNAIGSTIKLGWVHDGIVNFILTGTEGNYTGSNLNSSSWMKDNIALLGNKPLKDICITGSHDSGMSVYTSGTAFSHDCNTLTQSKNIQGQLSAGIRYFDIRPVISAGHYYTGHYGHIDQISSWQGANGQSIQSIVSDVNAFTAHNDELVILNLSHTLNTDVGNYAYRAFTENEWDGLFELLSGINHLYITDNKPDIDLTALTLNNFVSDGSAVLIIVEDNNVSLGARSGQGFYHYNNFNVFNSYADSNNLKTMADDQIEKMKQKSGQDYFLLSWTLTQNGTEATTCALGVASSIKDLANEANQNLAYLLYPNISPTQFPNIIYEDNVLNSGAAAMAMAVNWSVST